MNCAQARAQLGDYQEGNLELVQRSRVGDHLADCAVCEAELAELRSTVALLRSLPDPTVSPGLVDAVMQRIDTGETRVTRFPIRRVFEPWIAAPIAAGIAGLVWFGSVERAAIAPGPLASAPAIEQVVDSKAKEMWENAPPTLVAAARASGRTTVPVLVRPRLAHTGDSAPRIRFSRRPSAAVGFVGRSDPDPQGLDLDAELDRAKVLPEAFLRRVGQVEEIDRRTMFGPLVVRAARRGDAQVVAGRLRETSHPLAQSIAASFERSGRRAGTAKAIPASYR